MNLQIQLAKLDKIRARLTAKLEKQASKRLLALPGQLGFGSVDELVAALKRTAAGKTKGPAKAGKRRKRAVITDKTRDAVKKLTEEGKTGAAIAKVLKISLPSVQNIKKALGLVKARK
ncbi:MAG TPA: helix-turn-helix domain-containing protein [Opitutaceae bacterium]|nr:helix-turn-helix domain-containing protein [Opitutaceae bacterium]